MMIVAVSLRQDGACRLAEQDDYHEKHEQKRYEVLA